MLTLSVSLLLFSICCSDASALVASGVTVVVVEMVDTLVIGAAVMLACCLTRLEKKIINEIMCRQREYFQIL